MSDQVTEVEVENTEDLLVADVVFGSGEEAEKSKQDLMDWMLSELGDLRPSEEGDGNERTELEAEWREWRRMSVARPASKKKDEPWPGASNVTTPFMFSNINGVTSHVKAALTEKKPRHTVSTLNEKFKPHAHALQDWLNVLMESPLHINLPKYDEVIPYETARMGTQVVEIAWVDKRVQLKRGDEVIDKTVYEGPEIHPYRLEDVFIRDEWEDCQKAPVVFLRRRITWQDMQGLEMQGFFQNVEDVKGSPMSQQDTGRNEENETLGITTQIVTTPQPGHLYEVLKTYVRFDADNDGMAEDLIVWWQPGSRVILRAEFNEIGVRPVEVMKYVALPEKFYGLGVGWMLAPIQEEIDTLHNMRINSIHISSLQMYATRPGAEGIGIDEEFYPLKAIHMEEPGDFQVITFPNAAMETLQAENVAQQYGRSVTGISETQLGMPDTTAKSGTTPTLQQFLASQGNKVLRSTIANAERTYGAIGMDCLLLLVANSDRVLAQGTLLELANEEERPLIEEVLQMNVEDIPLTFQFTVRSTEIEETEDAKRQMVLTKTQLYTQYFQMAMETQMMMANPQVPEPVRLFATEMYVGMTKLMEETLELYNVDRPADLLPAYRIHDLMIQMLEASQKPTLGQMQKQLEAMNGQEQQGAGTDLGPYNPGYTQGEGPGGRRGVGGVPSPSGQVGGPGATGTGAGQAGGGPAASGPIPGAGRVGP